MARETSLDDIPPLKVIALTLINEEKLFSLKNIDLNLYLNK